jgi:hypothetical protein
MTIAKGRVSIFTFSAFLRFGWIIGSLIVPPPIAVEIDGLAALHCQSRYTAHLIAIRDAAVIFPP